MLKHNAATLTDIFTHIINLSFANGKFPEQLKLAKVIPIFKKDETYLTSNYRPISLLSMLSKILEKVVHLRLMSFLNKYKLLYCYQFGFRQKYSTILALIETVDNIQQDLENGYYVGGIYLDLSKAFDTVDHSILLDKLYNYGIRGHALSWFHSYLYNRKQFTVVNGAKSDVKTVTYGVPQGSVLGPLLFLIYTNDLVNSINPCNKLRLFADDSNVFITKSSPQELKSEMKTTLLNLFEWFKANKLSVNLRKTSYTIFANKSRKVPDLLNSITVNNIAIKRVSSAKYLGVTLDEKLKWDDHITSLQKTLMRTTNSFKIIKHYIPEKNKILLFNAYISSKIQYGIELYGRANPTLLNKIQIRQNRALKVLYNKDFLTPTNVLHSNFQILKVDDQYKLNVLKFVYKQQNNLLPEIFGNQFVHNHNIHCHNTRQSKKLHLYQHHTTHGTNKISYQGPKLWNSIPTEIQGSSSLKVFSKNVKNLVLKSYSS